MSETAYLLFFLLVFVTGWICGGRFVIWRIRVERRRNENFWNGKKNQVIRRI